MCRKRSSTDSCTDYIRIVSFRNIHGGPPVFNQRPIARTRRRPRQPFTLVREVSLKSAYEEAREERVGIQGELEVSFQGTEDLVLPVQWFLQRSLPRAEVFNNDISTICHPNVQERPRRDLHQLYSSKRGLERGRMRGQRSHGLP